MLKLFLFNLRNRITEYRANRDWDAAQLFDDLRRMVR